MKRKKKKKRKKKGKKRGGSDFLQHLHGCLQIA